MTNLRGARFPETSVDYLCGGQLNRQLRSSRRGSSAHHRLVSLVVFFPLEYVSTGADITHIHTHSNIFGGEIVMIFLLTRSTEQTVASDCQIVRSRSQGYTRTERVFFDFWLFKVFIQPPDLPFDGYYQIF